MSLKYFLNRFFSFQYFISFVIFFCYAIFLNVDTAHSQEFTPETPLEIYAMQQMPVGYALAHDLIETKAWNGQDSVIALFGYDDPKDPNIGFNLIYGHIYQKNSSGAYSDTKFGPIGEDGANPDIQSVFFVNADKDPLKELAVLVLYVQRHQDFNGDMYETYIFDNPAKNNELPLLKNISNKFDSCDCSSEGNRNEKAYYTNAASIKKKLGKMGFVQ